MSRLAIIFMKTVPTYILKNIFLLYCSISLAETSNNTISFNSVDVSVYNGEGTLLISWSAPDSIKTKNTRLYFKRFGELDYSLLVELSPDVFNYLHKNCIADARYFYKIEIEDMFGHKYYSDIEKPSFGTCLSINDSIQLNNNVKNIFDLVLLYINQSITNSSSSNHFYPLGELLKSNLKNQYNWIEDFPLKSLRPINEIINQLNEIINDDNLFDYVMDYEALYRNYFLLTPEIWSMQLTNVISKIRSNWVILYNEYSSATEFFDSIDPVRIIGSSGGNEIQNPVLQLYIFHPSEINISEWYLLSNDEYINLENYNIAEEGLFYLEIPKDWYSVKLMMNDKIIQSFPIIKNQSVVFTLDGEIVSSDVNENDFIKVKKDSSSLYFNEIIWNPATKVISVELAGMQKFGEEYIVNYDGKPLWKVDQNYSGFSMQYIDSSFVFSGSLGLPGFISLQKNTLNDTTTIEFIVMDTSSFSISRVPDNGSWVNSTTNTLGSTNQITVDKYSSELMPEFFVLYQNFPNPFNGQTRITFDLLENATVTLYVSDATGRIHDKLIEKEYITSGNYNFIWDGDGRSSGIYFITLQAEIENIIPAVYSRKMIYLK